MKLSFQVLEDRRVLAATFLGDYPTYKTAEKGEAVDLSFESIGDESVAIRFYGITTNSIKFIEPDRNAEGSWLIHSRSNWTYIAGTTSSTPGETIIRLIADDEETNITAYLDRGVQVLDPVIGDERVPVSSEEATIGIFEEPTSRHVKFSVGAGDILNVNLHSSGFDSRLLDNSGQVVTFEESFVLKGPESGTEEYTFELVPDTSQSAAFLLRFTDELPFIHRFRSFRAILDHQDQIRVSFPWTVDIRTCGIGDFSWDGPTIQSLEYDSPGGGLTLPIAGPVEEGYYELQIREGACTGLAGQTLEQASLTIDRVRPVLVESSLADGLAILTFNESLGGWSIPTGDVITVTATDGSITMASSDLLHFASDGVFSINLSGRDIDRLQLEFSVWDSSGNRSIWREYDLSASTEKSSPFDIDRNGIINRRDVDLLRALRHQRLPPHFDLSKDGRIDERDVDLLIREGIGSRPGDIDLDGDFDQDDLSRLLQLNPDQESHSWSTGDFNGDHRFDSNDLILALQHGWDGE